MQVTHTKQYRQTTTMSENLLGEQAIKQLQPAHKQGEHLSMFEGENWRARESVSEKKRESESESWCESGIEQQTKSDTTPPTTPVSGQLNHQESGKIPSSPSTNSSQNHISYDFTVANPVV